MDGVSHVTVGGMARCCGELAVEGVGNGTCFGVLVVVETDGTVRWTVGLAIQGLDGGPESACAFAKVQRLNQRAPLRFLLFRDGGSDGVIEASNPRRERIGRSQLVAFVDESLHFGRQVSQQQLATTRRNTG